MRRQDRAVTDERELRAILDSCKVCRIAMQDRDGLYIVPMNFGYTWEDGVLRLYFHSAGEGRKLEALAENPHVAFEMDSGHALVEGDTACAYAYRFQSIIGSGEAAFITDSAEKKKALSLLMQHQTGRDFFFDDRMAATVTVFQIRATAFTGKRHL